jgi:polysaccharide export outer membrane protein
MMKLRKWPAWARTVLSGLAACLALLAAPGMAAAQINETLGIGDTVRVTVFQNPDLTTEGRISAKGTIVMPLVGEVQIGGMTPLAAGNRVADQLKKGNFIRNPQVSVGVLQVRSRQVSVLGQVPRPGRYVLDDTSSKLTDVLALAGGIGPAGDDNVTVMLTRNGKTTQMAVDVPKMYRTGNLSGNIEVQNGDTIFVQRAPLFYIYGEVHRSGAYRLEPNMSVMHALSLGGGVTPRGTDRGIKIHRRAQDEKFSVVDAKLTDAVQADDVIYIKESLF